MPDKRLSLHGSAEPASDAPVPERAELSPQDGCAVCRVRCEQCRSRHVALIVDLSGQLTAERAKLMGIAEEAEQAVAAVQKARGENDERVKAANVEAATALDECARIKGRLDKVMAFYRDVLTQARAGADAVIGATSMPIPPE